jgi:hypothetical protein
VFDAGSLHLLCVRSGQASSLWKKGEERRQLVRCEIQNLLLPREIIAELSAIAKSGMNQPAWNAHAHKVLAKERYPRRFIALRAFDIKSVLTDEVTKQFTGAVW